LTRRGTSKEAVFGHQCDQKIKHELWLQARFTAEHKNNLVATKPTGITKMPRIGLPELVAPSFGSRLKRLTMKMWWSMSSQSHVNELLTP
jgi:hypothetical protein